MKQTIETLWPHVLVETLDEEFRERPGKAILIHKPDSVQSAVQQVLILRVPEELTEEDSPYPNVREGHIALMSPHAGNVISGKMKLIPVEHLYGIVVLTDDDGEAVRYKTIKDVVGDE